jgi:flavin reductase (DIM6/NTAB) family NADH-FMN oxidoreductase RutF
MRSYRQQIEALEQRYRTTFINSLAGFRQVVLVGSQSNIGTDNLAIFNSLIHLGAHPALFGLISRPNSVPRDTLENIRQSQEFSLNYMPAATFVQAHQTSARYDAHISEFEKTGIESEFIEGYRSPFVKNAIVQVAMKLEEIIPLSINQTVLIIGSIDLVIVDDAIVSQDGFVDLASSNTLLSQGLDAYYTAQALGRLPYAKP